MKREELIQTLTRLQKDTLEGNIHWELIVSTTEGASEKCYVKEEDIQYQVDECYSSFYCQYRGTEFCVISYEMIKTAEGKVNTINYVFLPPLGMRLFSLQALLPYSVEADLMLIHQIHTLYTLLMEMKSQNSPKIRFKLQEATVSIE